MRRLLIAGCTAESQGNRTIAHVHRDWVGDFNAALSHYYNPEGDLVDLDPPNPVVGGLPRESDAVSAVILQDFDRLGLETWQRVGS